MSDTNRITKLFHNKPSCSRRSEDDAPSSHVIPVIPLLQSRTNPKVPRRRRRRISYPILLLFVLLLQYSNRRKTNPSKIVVFLAASAASTHPPSWNNSKRVSAQVLLAAAADRNNLHQKFHASLSGEKVQLTTSSGATATSTTAQASINDGKDKQRQRRQQQQRLDGSTTWRQRQQKRLSRLGKKGKKVHHEYPNLNYNYEYDYSEYPHHEYPDPPNNEDNSAYQRRRREPLPTTMPSMSTPVAPATPVMMNNPSVPTVATPTSDDRDDNEKDTSSEKNENENDDPEETPTPSPILSQPSISFGATTATVLPTLSVDMSRAKSFPVAFPSTTTPTRLPTTSTPTRLPTTSIATTESPTAVVTSTTTSETTTTITTSDGNNDGQPTTILFPLPPLKLRATPAMVVTEWEWQDITTSLLDYFIIGITQQGWKVNRVSLRPKDEDAQQSEAVVTQETAAPSDPPQQQQQRRRGLRSFTSFSVSDPTRNLEEQPLPETSFSFLDLQGDVSFVLGSEPETVTLFWKFVQEYLNSWEWTDVNSLVKVDVIVLVEGGDDGDDDDDDDDETSSESNGTSDDTSNNPPTNDIPPPPNSDEANPTGPQETETVPEDTATDQQQENEPNETPPTLSAGATSSSSGSSFGPVSTTIVASTFVLITAMFLYWQTNNKKRFFCGLGGGGGNRKRHCPEDHESFHSEVGSEHSEDNTVDANERTRGGAAWLARHRVTRPTNSTNDEVSPSWSCVAGNSTPSSPLRRSLVSSSSSSSSSTSSSSDGGGGPESKNANQRNNSSVVGQTNQRNTKSSHVHNHTQSQPKKEETDDERYSYLGDVHRGRGVVGAYQGSSPSPRVSATALLNWSYYSSTSNATAAVEELPSLQEERQSEIDEEATIRSLGGASSSACRERVEDGNGDDDDEYEHLIDTASLLNHSPYKGHNANNSSFLLMDEDDVYVGQEDPCKRNQDDTQEEENLNRAILFNLSDIFLDVDSTTNENIVRTSPQVANDKVPLTTCSEEGRPSPEINIVDRSSVGQTEDCQKNENRSDDNEEQERVEDSCLLLNNKSKNSDRTIPFDNRNHNSSRNGLYDNTDAAGGGGTELSLHFLSSDSSENKETKTTSGCRPPQEPQVLDSDMPSISSFSCDNSSDFLNTTTEEEDDDEEAVRRNIRATHYVATQWLHYGAPKQEQEQQTKTTATCTANAMVAVVGQRYGIGGGNATSYHDDDATDSDHSSVDDNMNRTQQPTDQRKVFLRPKRRQKPRSSGGVIDKNDSTPGNKAKARPPSLLGSFDEDEPTGTIEQHFQHDQSTKTCNDSNTSENGKFLMNLRTTNADKDDNMLNHSQQTFIVDQDKSDDVDNTLLCSEPLRSHNIEKQDPNLQQTPTGPPSTDAFREDSAERSAISSPLASPFPNLVTPPSLSSRLSLNDRNDTKDANLTSEMVTFSPPSPQRDFDSFVNLSAIASTVSDSMTSELDTFQTPSPTLLKTKGHSLCYSNTIEKSKLEERSSDQLSFTTETAVTPNQGQTLAGTETKPMQNSNNNATQSNKANDNTDKTTEVTATAITPQSSTKCAASQTTECNILNALDNLASGETSLHNASSHTKTDATKTAFADVRHDNTAMSSPTEDRHSDQAIRTLPLMARIKRDRKNRKPSFRMWI